MTTNVLAGQVALITGGGRGLGRAFALGLAKAGMSVAVVARTPAQVDETAQLIRDSGGQAQAFTADISNPGAVAETIAMVERTLGPIDLLVNNAGASGPLGPSWEADPNDWWNCLEVNLRGTFLCCHAVLPGMIARGRGRIVNVASGAGTLAIPYMSAYVTSKSAVIRFTETLAAEVRQHGVQVFSIEPGTVRTEMAEKLIGTEVGRRWLPWFESIFAEGRDQSSEPGTQLVVFLASGAGDRLSGRFWIVPENPNEVASRAEDILRDDLYVLRVRRL